MELTLITMHKSHGDVVWRLCVGRKVVHASIRLRLVYMTSKSHLMMNVHHGWISGEHLKCGGEAGGTALNVSNWTSYLVCNGRWKPVENHKTCVGIYGNLWSVMAGGSLWRTTRLVWGYMGTSGL